MLCSMLQFLTRAHRGSSNSRSFPPSSSSSVSISPASPSPPSMAAANGVPLCSMGDITLQERNQSDYETHKAIIKILANLPFFVLLQTFSIDLFILYISNKSKFETSLVSSRDEIGNCYEILVLVIQEQQNVSLPSSFYCSF